MSSHLPRYNVPGSSSPGRKRRYGQSRLRLVELSRRTLCFSVVGTLLALYLLLVLHRRFLTIEKVWLPPFNRGRPVTLCYTYDDLRRLWKWEVESGHYPSGHELPALPGFTEPLLNPARPPNAHTREGSEALHSTGVGLERIYLRPSSDSTSQSVYPPRPVPGSAADMDIVMQHCDYTTGKYTRDCLKFLRRGGGLDNTTRGVPWDCDQECKYIYVHDTQKTPQHSTFPRNDTDSTADSQDLSRYQHKRSWDPYEKNVKFPPLQRPSDTTHCDEKDPRVFHMYWQGSFTDKPYMAILSFLYTQNLDLHVDPTSPEFHSPPHCRPQLWIWIHRQEWAAYAPADWEAVMLDELKRNVWAKPFLHPRFKDAVHFKAYDPAAQLQAVPELREDWGAKSAKGPRALDEAAPGEERSDARHNNISSKAARGLSASDEYNLDSVVASDKVRFILCHRFGGIYLDVDLLFLRDWEELWGWQGAFAYRWSRLDRYNTAVLRLHRQSALGTLFLRTAYRNGMDFHPARVTRYVKDAQMEELFLMAPVALFDPAWLDVEEFQRDRPPQPHFLSFGDFWETPPENAAQPEALGFDGFFKGAYAYHWHNQWWVPFDRTRNYPDLGARFISREQPRARDTQSMPTDISWSAVLKRTFEAYIRGERPNMYGEWIRW